MELIFDHARPEDVDALTELFIAYSRELEQYEMAYTLQEATLPASILSRIRSKMALAAVARDGEKVVGFLFATISRLSGYTFEDSPLFGYISDTYVLPRYRGFGIARDLARMALQWLRDNEVGYTELKVLHSNENAHRFWTSLGFAPTTCVYGMKNNEKKENHHES